MVSSDLITNTQDDLRLRREARVHVQLYLSEGEELLIRRIRQADYKGADWQFARLKAERMAEDRRLFDPEPRDE